MNFARLFRSGEPIPPRRALQQLFRDHFLGGAQYRDYFDSVHEAINVFKNIDSHLHHMHIRLVENEGSDPEDATTYVEAMDDFWFNEIEPRIRRIYASRDCRNYRVSHAQYAIFTIAQMAPRVYIDSLKARYHVRE